MSVPVPQLAGVQLELAMALSSSLELEAMLRATLGTLLRRLDCRAAAVFSALDAAGAPAPVPVAVAVLPRGAALAVDDAVRAAALEAAAASSSAHRRLDDGAGERHLFTLPGFGVLELRRGGAPLEPAVFRALAPVLERLATAARACASHAALRASEQRYQALAASLPDVLLEAEPQADGVLWLTFVSARAEALLGVAADALVARPGTLEERLHADDRARWARALATAATGGGELDVVVRLADPGGAPRWLQLLATRPAPGRRYVGAIRDVTAQQQVAAAERGAAQLRVAAMLASVPDAIVAASADGVIAHWNRGAEALLGYRAADAVGQPLARVIPGQPWLAHHDAPARGADAGATTVLGRQVELPARHADGHEVPVEVSVSRVEDSGEVMFVAVLRDLTERRAREVARQRAAEAERRFSAVLVRLAHLPTDDLAAFEREFTAAVSTALVAGRVSLWSLDAGAITCRDLYLRATDAHEAGLVLREADYPEYFAALQSEESIVADDARAHPATARFTPGYLVPLGIYSMLDVPLRSLDGLRGVVCVESLEPRAWNPEEIRFCTEVASLAVQALDRAHRQQAEARHAAVLASIGDAVIACDTEGRVTLLNHVAESLTGWRAVHALGRPVREVFRVVAADTGLPVELSVEGMLAASLSFGTAAGSLLVRRDGTEVPIADSAAPVIERGQLRGVVVTFRDVSVEQEVQQELQRQNQQLRSLSQAIPDLLFIVDTAGRIQYVGQERKPDLLVAPDEIPSTTLASVFEPALAARLLAAVERAAGTGELHSVEYALDLPAGRQHFEARMAPMTAREVTVMVRNVTEARTRQQALEFERAQLRAVLAASTAVIYSLRLPEFATEFVSESAREVFGVAPEAVAVPGYWASAVHPDDAGWVQVRTAELFDHGTAIREYRHRHADGSYRWLRDQLRLVYDAAGQPVRAVGAAIDITERKLDEQRLTALLAMQGLVSRISAGFLGADAAAVDVMLAEALSGVGQQAAADRAYVFLLRGDVVDNTHEWCRDGVASQRESLQGIPTAAFAFFLQAMAHGEALFVDEAHSLPEHAAAERTLLAALGIDSLMALPLVFDGALRGFLGLDNPRLGAIRPEEFANQLRVLGDTMSAGLQHAASEAALRELNVRLTQQAERQRGLLQLSTELARASSRDELGGAVRRSIAAVVAADRIALAEVLDGRQRTRIAPLTDDLPRLDDAAELFAADGLPVERLERTAIAAALRAGAAVSTRDAADDAYADWAMLRDAPGSRQFVVAPLAGPRGALGTLCFSMPRPEPPTIEELAWVEQFAAVVAAHLSILRGVEALQDLNADLEQRVDARTAELKASEERFERLFLYAPQAMLIADRSRRIVQSNLGARALFGYGEAEFAALPVNALVPEAQRGGHEALMNRYGDDPRSWRMAPDRVVGARRADGGTFQGQIRLVPLELNGEWAVLIGISDVTSRMAAEQALKASLREKETLLKEIHHRVKNNLQIISSLLMLQSDAMPSPESRALLTESVQRVRSMALIHQQLYGMESLERVELGQYARTLAASLQATLAPSARVVVDAATVELPVDLAVPLGLILNEFLTNAFKYGLVAGRTAGGRTGPDADVVVQVEATDDELRLAVLDSGPGMPAGYDPARASSLGLQLVRSLNRQIRGKLLVDSADGARFEVRCARPAT